MDAIVKKLIGMLGDERMDRRCAAAMVIGELRLKEPEVVDGLGRCLSEDNRMLQLYALEALASARTPKIAALVTPLLDHADEELRTQASALLAGQGAKATASLAKELAGAPVTRQRAIISILVRSHDGETIERLLALLPDAELGEYTLNALRGEVEHLTGEEPEELRARVAALLKNKAWLAEPAGTSRALRLLGYLRVPKSVKTILGFTSDKHPVPVRVAALAALRRPLAASSSVDEAAEELLRIADDPDPTLARAAVDTLRTIQLPAGMTAQLSKLAEGRHAETRKFALEALGRAGGNSGSNKVLKSLLAALGGSDPTARETAAAGLGRMEGAGQALAGELASSLGDPERVRLLCRLLRRHPDAQKPAIRQEVGELTAAALEEGTPAAEPLLELLSAIDPDGYAKLLGERAHAHRKAKRFDQAFALFSKLDSAGLLDDESRYAALVSGLCALPSKKELARASRTTDPVLRLLVALLSKGEPVGSKLRKEKCLTPDDLFYLGFNFTESKDDDEKELGAELLGHLAEKAPRTKLGRSAKNKLHLMGLD